jgi:hypothetical protein
MLIFDDSEPMIPTDGFNVCDWSSQYPEASERIPHDAPEALGHSVVTTCYVDADHELFSNHVVLKTAKYRRVIHFWL